MVAKHLNKKYAGKSRALAINALAALAATFSAVAFNFFSFNNDAKLRQSEFCSNFMYHDSDPG